jgi:hypothetical protein
MSQIGGSFLTDVADLAIPFGLLIALKGAEMAKSKSKTKTRKKTTMRGGMMMDNDDMLHESHDAHCYLCSKKAGGGRSSAISNEVRAITSELDQLLNEF